MLLVEILTIAFSLYYYKKFRPNQYYVFITKSMNMTRSDAKKKFKVAQSLLMSIYLLAISILTHSVFCVVMYLAINRGGLIDKSRSTFATLIFVRAFMIVLEHFLNVFILWRFDYKFHKRLNLNKLFFFGTAQQSVN